MSIYKGDGRNLNNSWLDNFIEGTERETAKLLLEHVRVLPTAEVQDRLTETLLERASDGTLTCPTAIVPVLDASDIKIVKKAVDDYAAAKNKQANLIESISIDGQVTQASNPEIQPDASEAPIPQLISMSPGSEALIGKVVRDFLKIRRRRGERIWSTAGLNIEKLRKDKVRSLVIATDSIGSGDQVESFARELSKSRTIRSWRSGGYFKVIALSMTATRTGLQALARSKFIDEVIFVEPSLDLDTVPWTYLERRAVVALCRKYGRVREYELGYKESGMLTAFEHGVPNTMPCILWQNPKNWTPLFSDRQVPTAIIGSTYAALQESRTKREPTLSALNLQILYHLSKSPLTIEEIAFIFKLSVHTASARTAELKFQGYIYETPSRKRTKFSVSKLGMAEVRDFFPTRPRRSPASFSEDLYYPSSLRDEGGP